MYKDRHKPNFVSSNIKSGILLSGTLAAVTVVTGAILMSTSVSADDPSVVDEVNVTVPISCSLSGTGMDTHNDNVNNGQYKADIGTTTLTAFCNDNNGFAIYANGYTNNEDGSNVLSNTTLGTTHDIASGIAESGDTSNWAMKLTKKTDSGDTTGTNAFTIDSAPNTESGTPASFETYHTVPTEFTKVAHKDSSTDMDTTNGGVTLTTTYAAYINKTQAAGTYSGKVKYVLVHPSTAPAPSTALIMQEVANWKDSLQVGDEVDAIDTRDNKIYKVAKLADGNIWMTQNLDHDIKADGSVTYDSTTTDLPSGTTWTPASATKPTSDTTWTTGSAGYTIPESYDPGDLYWNGVLTTSLNDQTSCEAAGGTWSGSSCGNPVVTSSTGTPNYHLGNYYNWTASLAMSDSSSLTTDGTVVNQSICPAGWTLPLSGSNTGNKSFQNLVTQYGWSNNTMNDPYIWNSDIKLALSGYWYGGEAPGSVGYYGGFWFSVVRNSSNAYRLLAFSYGVVDPANVSNRYSGFSVRCVSR